MWDVTQFLDANSPQAGALRDDLDQLKQRVHLEQHVVDLQLQLG